MKITKQQLDKLIEQRVQKILGEGLNDKMERELIQVIMNVIDKYKDNSEREIETTRFTQCVNYSVRNISKYFSGDSYMV